MWGVGLRLRLFLRRLGCLGHRTSGSESTDRHLKSWKPRNPEPANPETLKPYIPKILKPWKNPETLNPSNLERLHYPKGPRSSAILGSAGAAGAGAAIGIGSGSRAAILGELSFRLDRA